MNQSRAFLISFLFAGLAGFMVFFYVNQEREKVKAVYGTEVVVVVAKTDINEMEQIQASMLTTAVVPKSFAQPSYDSDPRTFEGSVASSPIKKGEQLLLTKVLLKGAATGIASQVAIQRRAISIPVGDTTGVNRLIRPGDRVDLIALVQYQGPEGVQKEIKTILQNVHVLAVGEVVQNQVPSAFENDPVTGNRRAMNMIRGNRSFGNITIEVTPQDAQRIIYVLEDGTIYLTLRNPVDRTVSSVPTTTVDEVLGPNSRKAERERAVQTRSFATERIERKPVLPPPPPAAPAFSSGGVPIAN